MKKHNAFPSQITNHQSPIKPRKANLMEHCYSIPNEPVHDCSGGQNWITENSNERWIPHETS